MLYLINIVYTHAYMRARAHTQIHTHILEQRCTK